MCGCGAKYWTGAIEPETVFSYNPWSGAVELRDTKENTIEVTDLKAGIDGTKSVSVASLRILNHSSPVIAADAARMEQVKTIMELQLELHRIFGQNAALIIATTGEAAPKILSALPQVNVNWDALGSGGVGVAPCPLNPTEPTDEPE